MCPAPGVGGRLPLLRPGPRSRPCCLLLTRLSPHIFSLLPNSPAFYCLCHPFYQCVAVSSSLSPCLFPLLLPSSYSLTLKPTFCISRNDLPETHGAWHSPEAAGGGSPRPSVHLGAAASCILPHCTSASALPLLLALSTCHHASARLTLCTLFSAPAMPSTHGSTQLVPLLSSRHPGHLQEALPGLWKSLLLPRDAGSALPQHIFHIALKCYLQGYIAPSESRCQPIFHP